MGQTPRAGRQAGQDEIFEHVSQVVLAVSSQLSVRDVLQMIVRSARSLAGARYAALGVPDEAGTFAEFVVDGLSARASRPPSARCPASTACSASCCGRASRCGWTTSAPIRGSGAGPAAHPDLTDVLGVPIKDGEQILGFIFAACKTVPGGFTERDERLVSLFAAHAAIALTNARLYERGRELSVLQERARLARDLHDAVSQKLFSVRAKARAAAVLVRPRSGRAIEEIDSVAELAGQAHAELRAVIDGLAPPELAAGGLAGSVRGYAVLAGRTYGADVRRARDDLPDARPGTGRPRSTGSPRKRSATRSGIRAARSAVSLSRRQRSVVLEVSDARPRLRPSAPAAGSRPRLDARAGRLRRRHADNHLRTGNGHKGPADGPGGRGFPAGCAAADERRRHDRGPITVLIADDHPVVRQGLAVLLEVQDDITLVGEAGDRPRGRTADPSSMPRMCCCSTSSCRSWTVWACCPSCRRSRRAPACWS